MGIDRRSEGGFALVIVLWVLAILTVVALGFAERALLERKMAWYALDQVMAQNLARAAVERAIVEILNKEAIDAFYRQSGYVGADQRWARPVDLLEEANYFSGAKGREFENDSCYYRIEDCERRVSVNFATMEMLDKLPGVTPAVIREIRARKLESTGGENDQGAYNAPMQGFQTLEEFRDAGKIPDEDWYGAAPGTGLRDLLTVWGVGQINLNTASEAVLRTVPTMDEDLLAAILGYRSGPDGTLGTGDDRAFKRFEEIPALTGVSAEKVAKLQQYCAIMSYLFRIEAVATRRQGKVRAYCEAVVSPGGGGVDSGAGDNRMSNVVVYWKEGFFGT